MRHRLAIFAAVVLVAGAGCADRETAAGAWKGRIDHEDGVTIVRNPMEPVHPGPALALTEDWTIGGAGASDESILVIPRSLAVDENGNVFVLDNREPFVKVFDAEGRYLRSFGRQGQGPGELDFAGNICLPPESDKVAVFGGHYLHWFDLAGGHLDSARIPSWAVTWSATADSQDRFTLSEMSPLDRMERLVRIESQTGARTEIFSRPAPRDPNPFSSRLRWAQAGRNFLIVGDPREYELLVLDAEGSLVRRILRDHKPVPVSREDIDEFESRRTPPGISHAGNVYSKNHAAFRSLIVDDLGQIFVQTWEQTSDRKEDIHDIFDAEGRFIGRAPLPRHADLINPKTRILKKGKLYAIEPDDEGYDVVKQYSVTWLIE
ncbi:MAG: 6-bladed beta-propeller [Acidobacteriota bacterium]|nr:6-bladed beta-propeller [Acidobacteriota bacterium]